MSRDISEQMRMALLEAGQPEIAEALTGGWLDPNPENPLLAYQVFYNRPLTFEEHEWAARALDLIVGERTPRPPEHWGT